MPSHIDSLFLVPFHQIESRLVRALKDGFGLDQIEFFSPANLHLEFKEVSLNIIKGKEV